MKFQQGQSGNPAGRPKGSKTKFSLVDLEAAIVQVEGEKKINLYRHFVERALVNDHVLVALMKKLIPDVQARESEVDQGCLDFNLKILPSNLPQEKVDGFKRFIQ